MAKTNQKKLPASLFAKVILLWVSAWLAIAYEPLIFGEKPAFMLATVCVSVFALVGSLAASRAYRMMA